MALNSNKAIYLQMADSVADDILSGRYGPDERIPSVRELAVSIGVNPNTAVKAYDELARDGIIYNRRGLGYYVTKEARYRILDKRRKEFFDNTMPEVVKQMKLLNISIEEVAEYIKKRSVNK